MTLIALALFVLGMFFSHGAGLLAEDKEPYGLWLAITWVLWGGAVALFIL
jgi:hypothetical protein